MKNRLEKYAISFHFILISLYRVKLQKSDLQTALLIHIGDDKVSPITSIKYLGVHVDQYLNQELHLLTIINKVSPGIGMLRLAKRYLPLETVQMMYRSLIEPYFRYCCPIWGSASSANLQRLQKLQNRAARIVTDSPYDAHSEPLIKNSVNLLLSN